MHEIIIKRYCPEDEGVWNAFLENSRMPMFMFNRNYMDYHKDRYIDHSLMIYQGDELMALLPINEEGHVFYSHGGLTYGGLIVGEAIKQAFVINCLDELIKYAENNQISTIVYKTIPFIFCRQAAEEDQYALFKCEAHIRKMEASTVINLKDPYEMSKLRRRKIKQAVKHELVFEECFEKSEYSEYVDVLNGVLLRQHNVKAVHTAEELFMLHQRFPENIRLFVAKKNRQILAGTVIFEYESVIHTQYLAASDIGRQCGALDYVIFSVIELFRNNKKWLDFGISTEDNGHYLNEGLISQKEGFGGRTVVYKTWEISVN